MHRPSRMVRLVLLTSACWAVCVPVSGIQAQGNARGATKAQIETAISRAQRMMLSRLAGENDSHAALATIALLKSGMDPKSPEIQKVCDRLCTHVTKSNYNPGMHHVYEAGVTLLALANADPKKYRKEIQVIADYIIANQGKQGQWHYPNAQEGDTSISQYAMLGLWEAQRAGVVVPMEVWDRSAGWHIQMQQRDGGFAYHPSVMAQVSASLHSMTAAGIGSLRISRRYLYPGARQRVVIDTPQQQAAKKNRSGKRFGILEPVFRDETPDDNSEDLAVELRNARYVPAVKLAQIDESVDKAVEWMTKNFTVERPTGYPIYFLYGLERASALTALKAYGTHDWYEEGAAHLVATQTPSDSWSDSSGEIPAAAFGVLFLVRATSKMVEPDIPRVEFGTGILVGGRGLPDDLKESQVNDGKVKKTAKKTPLEDLLTQLENPQIPLLESTQAEIVEQVVIGDRNKLIGQIDRLKVLAKHPDAEVRRTALWALGRSDDLRVAPILVAGLKDADVDVFVEARNALRCLSRQVEDFGLKEAPLDAASREREWQKWRDWYRSVRAYVERDDLVNPGE